MTRFISSNTAPRSAFENPGSAGFHKTAFHHLHDEIRAAERGFVLVQASTLGTGMPACQGAITRYSRSMACAEGKSLAAGPGLARIT